VSLTDYLKRFLLKSFDVREGEYRRVFLMQLNIFLIIFTLLIIKPVVNAQFISVIGIDQLPIVFVLVAIFAMVVSTLYSKALNTSSLQKVTTVTLVVSVVSLIVFGLLLHFNFIEDLTLYALYIGVAIFGVLATSQFWIMANLAFDAREAKRLFSFIGAGPIVGGVAGGYVASLIASSIEGTNLLFLGAALLCFCIPLNNTIWKNHIKTLTVFQRKKRFTDFGDHPFWLIRKSKHLTYLALVIGLSVLVSKLVEFQFSSVASANFKDPDELTSFFGFWFSTFNVVSLLIQLFLTKRIVGMFGVGTSLFVLPGGVFLGSLVLLFSPVLWAGIFTKLWEVSVKQSVNKSATELLSLPIPLAIKSQTKSFIDVFVDLAATGVAGLFLMFLVNGLDLSVRSVSILTIIILGVWVWLAIRVRHEYINSFKSKLTQADKDAIKTLPDFNNISVLDGLRRALETGSESQIVYVLKKVSEIPDKRLFDNVLRFLNHPSAKVRIEALHLLFAKNS
jgi:AAA family ATP:ADP antiporter